MKIFNSRTPDDTQIHYFSVAGCTESLNIWHPLWLPKVVLDGANGREGNDGLVESLCVSSCLWTLSSPSTLSTFDEGNDVQGRRAALHSLYSFIC